jgi:glycosyltransferase involved in cell wall biosynthesis
MQRTGYARADRILIGDWRFAESLAKLELSELATYFPLPYHPGGIGDSRTVDRGMASEFWPHAITAGKFVFFMPSAHLFGLEGQGKGTDRALGAFLRLSEERKDVILVTSSWGRDAHRARQIVKDAGKDEKVAFLPYVVSRPVLKAFYRASNVVLEEFSNGSYGSSTLEAMACERSVIQYVDFEKYRPYLRRLPPVLQARTENEIYEKMKWAVENPADLKAIAKESRDWVEDQHSVECVRILEQVIPKAFG